MQLTDTNRSRAYSQRIEKSALIENLEKKTSAINIGEKFKEIAPGRVYVGEEINDDFTHDEMSIYGKAMPEAVIDALTTEEISAIMKICYENTIPVTPRGAGTGLVGAAVPVEGGIETLDVDLVVVAIGVSPNPIVPASVEGLETGRKGVIVVGDDMQSSIPMLYAGGDIVRGGATVILAMGDGKHAAEEMDKALNQSTEFRVQSTTAIQRKMLYMCHSPRYILEVYTPHGVVLCTLLSVL